MNRRVLLATFEHEHDLLASAIELRKRNYAIVDAFTPYPVHGLDRALGLPPSRLTWVCFVCGMIGALGMLFFEYWVGAISWAVNVGGKPWHSLPSNVPVAFETAVLLAGFGSVFALFAVCRLFPGKQPSPLFERATDDQFVLLLDEADSRFDPSQVLSLLREFNVVDLEERIIKTGEIRKC
ncbi:MAG: DUF3341 domain-containing protein [Pirellulales bacterium]|nr:DUF3341 domain-containing protein [Pirellulales bacterium]